MPDITTTRFKPQKFQRKFFHSTADFPCRVGPWGDGKTLNMIMKGMYLSMLYPGNEGLIIRKRFNALERSTMRDFTNWTGLKVPKDTKTVEIPGCGSRINFAHCENMDEFRDGIQGMNLGWAGIEQGDELESADVFEMLMGRLRRILTPNKEIQSKLIEAGLLQGYVDDFATIPRRRRNRIERYLSKKMGIPVRQIMVIANACGHNWVWKRWVKPAKQKKLLKGYAYSEGKPWENIEYIPKITRDNWKILKKTSIKKYNRYVLNSHEDYDIEGSYYASLMSDALKAGRCEITTLFDRSLPVWTVWDLGVDDETAIWFIQIKDDSFNFIDYYANSGEGIEHYSEELDARKYHYAGHFLPHDAKQRLQGREVTTRFDILKRLRRAEDVHIIEKTSIADRIQAARTLIPKCKFAAACEEGVEALNRYHREINKAKSTEEKTVFVEHPAHDQYSHAADAFGGFAVVVEYTPTILDIASYAGYEDDYDEVDSEAEDLLEVA